MQLKPETTGFVRGGSLFLEPPTKWRNWQRDVWTCCPDELAKAVTLLRRRAGQYTLRAATIYNGGIIAEELLANARAIEEMRR